MYRNEFIPERYESIPEQNEFILEWYESIPERNEFIPDKNYGIGMNSF